MQILQIDQGVVGTSTLVIFRQILQLVGDARELGSKSSVGEVVGVMPDYRLQPATVDSRVARHRT